MSNRRAKVQGNPAYPREGIDFRPGGTVAWAEHLEAWDAYAKRFGREHPPEFIEQRGGFRYLDFQVMLGRAPKTWEPE
jgi:hypothetical protein